MDNLTHSLVGLALGELVDRALPAPSDPARGRTRRRLLLATGLLASNFPDLDLVLTPLLPAPLGYLIHHRGHTHTLLYALPQVALLLAMLWLLWPGARRLVREDGRTRRAVVATALLGMVLHLSFDALNVYGVHPFHPFDSRWLYGDLVFIVEPVFWTALGVAVALPRGPRLRWPLLAFFAATPLVFTWLGFLQWGSLALLAAIGLAVGAAHHRCGGRAGLLTACALCLGFVGVQGLAGVQARAQVRAALAQLAPGARVFDIPLSSFPANPLCWSFATVSEDAAGGNGPGNYAVRVGVLSLAPGLSPVASCPVRFGGQPGSEQPALAWKFSQTRSVAEFRALQRDNCHFDAWLRFARVPALAGGVATDVRFGAPDQPNFSTLPYAERQGAPCPAPLPGWGYPRADLLGWDRPG
ncbi:metal-dependent hydrolase [Massilia sp. G4R7]|uniref:Metal-dependent hydrolase n=1 Tax=Massilia phyllostachyos TaxID=2898585 RepID=A0ABS8QCY1_9BURK|nr:metal-dependent hydrolase [Massilia phyllostachyos]MCD2518480.1 metal-dependent hydrolase [Massilia phyllostachyos]